MLNIQRSPKACYRWRENLPGCDCRPDRKMGFTQSEVVEDEKASYNEVGSSVEKQSDKANWAIKVLNRCRWGPGPAPPFCRGPKSQWALLVRALQALKRGRVSCRLGPTILEGQPHSPEDSPMLLGSRMKTSGWISNISLIYWVSDSPDTISGANISFFRNFGIFFPFFANLLEIYRYFTDFSVIWLIFSVLHQHHISI